MNTHVITAKPGGWQRRALTASLLLGEAALLVLHLLLGVIVLALRTARVIVAVIAETAIHAEQALAAHTGRPALSQTGIAAIGAAFVAEFRAAYHQPTTR